MNVIELIKKKRDKKSLTSDEIQFVIDGVLHDRVSDYQMSAFLMAVFLNGMNKEEAAHLTESMLKSGEIVSHASTPKPLIDKHSTGGVGDKISIPLAPAVAACGLKVPMIAGRGLGHTGGTLDKLESIKGFNTNLTLSDYKKIVSEIDCVIMGQTKEIAPADKKIYALRDVTATVESIPLITSSILSKKLAEGIDGLLLDVKVGSGAFMKDQEQALQLARSMCEIASSVGKRVTCVLTDMSQPLGKYIGNSLEIIECIDILKNQGPKDTTELTIELGSEMLLLGKVAKNIEQGRKLMSDSLSSGRAFEKFVHMVEAQGGAKEFILEPTRLPVSKKCIPILAQQSGFVSQINSCELGMALCELGGGRLTKNDSIDFGVGIEMHKKISDPVEKGEPLCTLLVNDRGVEQACKKAGSAFAILNKKSESPKLFLHRFTTEN